MDDRKADLSSLSRHIFNRAIKYIKMGGPIRFTDCLTFLCVHVSILLKKSPSLNDPCLNHVLRRDGGKVHYAEM